MEGICFLWTKLDLWFVFDNIFRMYTWSGFFSVLKQARIKTEAFTTEDDVGERVHVYPCVWCPFELGIGLKQWSVL